MAAPLIPANAIGCIGMVAALKRIQGHPDGRLVVVRHAIGHVAELVGSSTRVFAWQVALLGNSMDLNGKQCREVIVADRCLQPVSQVPADEVENLIKTQSQADFNAAMGDLASIMKGHEITPDDLDSLLERACEQALIQHALQVVSITQVVVEAGFRQIHPPDGETYRWIGVHDGVELAIEGGPDWFGRWRFWSAGFSGRELFCGEQVALAEWPRGRVMQVIGNLWRSAFGTGQLPDAFTLGDLYQRHMEDLRQLQPGLPFVEVSGDALRRARRWLTETWRPDPGFLGPPPDAQLNLEIENGLLYFRTPQGVVTAPVLAGWLDPCTVSLRGFLNAPAWTFRGHRTRINWTESTIHLNAWVTLARTPLPG